MITPSAGNISRRNALCMHVIEQASLEWTSRTPEGRSSEGVSITLRGAEFAGVAVGYREWSRTIQ